MATYIIELPENYDWEGVRFHDASVWGQMRKWRVQKVNED